MPRNSGGIYSLPPVYLATPGETIMTEQHNAPLEDIANGITESLPRSGVAPMTGDLKMGGQKITGLGAPIADTDAARKVDINIPAASETVAGKVELATAAETITGTDTTRAVHPAGSKAAIDDAISDLGLNAGATMPVADQAAAEAGTGNGSLMTPLRTRQAIDAGASSINFRSLEQLEAGEVVRISQSGEISANGNIVWRLPFPFVQRGSVRVAVESRVSSGTGTVSVVRVRNLVETSMVSFPTTTSYVNRVTDVAVLPLDSILIRAQADILAYIRNAYIKTAGQNIWRFTPSDPLFLDLNDYG